MGLKLSGLIWHHFFETLNIFPKPEENGDTVGTPSTYL